MNNIFCLETEWTQSIHDLKDDSSVLPLLEYIKRVNRTKLVFRQVATMTDFDYYLSHLLKDSYNTFDIVYLCFHGASNTIEFANKETISLTRIGELYPGVFDGKKVHFGSCSTLSTTREEAYSFKEATGAKLLTGYSKKVGFTESFIFELWLMNVLTSLKSLGPIKLEAKIMKEMPFFRDRLGFKIY